MNPLERMFDANSAVTVPMLFRIRVTKLTGGERLPLVVDPRGLPVPSPNQWSLFIRRPQVQQNTLIAYFIQEWTYRVWNAAPRSPITKADVDAITELAIARLDESFFRVRFDRLTDLEKRYLRAMADLPEPVGSGAVATLLVRSNQSLTMTRNSLIKKGMIYSPKHGEVAFTVPMFDDFMRRNMPPQDRPRPKRATKKRQG
jgi:hypothetical protein